jgi:hypothetical protein
MKTYKGGRIYAGLCQFFAVVLGLVAWVVVGLTGNELGNMSWFVGFFVGLFVALPLVASAEVLEAIFDIAENSYKLVDLLAVRAEENKG